MPLASVPSQSPARERVLTVAEHLFAERGFAAVTLRDIASELGMRQASLYHHVPGGKEDLFVEVMLRGFNRHHQGLTDAIASAGSDLREQLQAAARWMVSQPPMDIERLVHSDMPELDPANARRVWEAAKSAMFAPIATALGEATRQGVIPEQNIGLVTGSFLALVTGVHTSRDWVSTPVAQTANQVIDILLDGILPRDVSSSSNS